MKKGGREVIPVPNLDEGLADDAASVLRMAAGAVPVVGGVLAELVELIPGQRDQRVADFVAQLGEALNRLGAEQEDLRSRVRSDAAKLELLERGAVSAARSSAEDRRRHIAEMVARGMATEECRADEVKTLLFLLGDLSDTEVLFLIRWSFDRGSPEEAEFVRRHSELRPASGQVGVAREERDRRAFQDHYLEHLVRLGLVIQRSAGNQPVASHLGRMLLRFIGERE